mmetsp:Transcript_98095/g.316333  ORF Transcript_98095/g.316333 Transcript_98095/m.316333 type:complete len:277 (+) Transcript_98095:122-952(+)
MSVSTVYDDVVVGKYQIDSDEEAKAPAGVDVVARLPEGQGGAGQEAQAEGAGEPGTGKVRRPPADEEAEGGSAKRPRPAELLGDLRRQIEYYFSDANLSQDDFFHGKISEDPDGWLDASWLLGCPRVEAMGVTDEAEIEAALAGSHLETRRGRGAEEDAAAEAAAARLRVRRPGGLEALPKLLQAGWLKERIAERRRAAAGPAEEAPAPEAACQPPEALAGPAVVVGSRVRLHSGEYSGQSGQVLALDGEDVTLMLESMDVVTVAAGELGAAAPAA